MHIHFIIHESFEAPGAFLQWAEQRKHTVGFSRLYNGDKIPDTIDNIDLLIVMGGPQSPATTAKECSYFDAQSEKNVIRKFINCDKAVVGVCLGAQLIGEALGATYEHSPEKEIGFFPIVLTPAGKQDRLFSHFEPVTVVGHWHGDMPGLTSDSKVLAVSEGCPRQIIAYRPFIYGFQCHLELTPEVMEGLMAHSKEELFQHKKSAFIQSPEALRNHSYTAINDLLFGFLNKLEEAYLNQ